MLRRLLQISFLLFLLSIDNNLIAQQNEGALFSWEQLSQVPTAPATEFQSGLAGAFSGVHNDVLIIAGGANFPDGKPWEGGMKAWHDDIFILKKESDETYRWLEKNYKLPQPLAYGVSIPTKDGLIIIGGCDASECYPTVFLLKWSTENQTLEIEELPALPFPLGFMTGAKVADRIYLAGGQSTMENAVSTKHFLSLDLNKKDADNFEWEILPSWDGEARILPLGITQGDGLDNGFFLFSGRNVQKNQAPKLLSDVHFYNPKIESWTQLPDIQLKQEDKRCIMGATGVAMGAAHIFIFGGDDGAIFSTSVKNNDSKKEIEKSLSLMENASSFSIQKRDSLALELNKITLHQNHILDNHPGFSKDILSYHTITNSWTKIGELPFTTPVTTTAFFWEKDIIIPSGEISPGIRTSAIQKLELAERNWNFGWLNYLVLAIYFGILLLIGWHFSKKQKSTDDYFKGGGRIPWWAAGLSIFGTVLSAITFMAIPAKTFATDWSYLMYNMGPVLTAPIIIFLFVPFYHRLNLTTAYEYLEKRFNVVARLLGSLSFMVFQLGRIGIVLYLPAIALNVVTDFDILLCISLMGIISIIYTLMGGIEGVIWTDVIQVIVLMGGAVLSLFWILGTYDGNISEIWEIANREDKFNVFDMTFDWTQPTFWVVFAGGIFSNIVFYGTDQTVVQRYLTSKDISGANKSVWTNALLVIPATLLFFTIGTVLFAYYKAAPAQLQPGLESTDALFPWYIISNLPQGISGLLIAGVFAAAMSSLSSSMNSVASSYTTDFHHRFKWKGTPLNVARWSTLIIGILGTAFAMLMATSDIKSLWDEFIKVVGLITGGLGGLFVLGMISKKANAPGALIGLVYSALIQGWIAWTEPVHLLLFTATGLFSCMIIGYLASFFFRNEEKDISGLTL